MTSAANKPSSHTGGRRAEGGGPIAFASVLLLALGSFNVIDGIAAIANSHVFLWHARWQARRLPPH